ncbi:MAG: hypothetical protein AAGJ31_11030 [Verrucomicrobiota bacterium]
MGPPSVSCRQSQRAFEEGQTIYSVLSPREGGTSERLDYAEEVWPTIQQKTSPLSFWKTTFVRPAAEQQKEEAMTQRDDLEQMFRDMLEGDLEGNQTLCYCLALLLERKRLFRFVNDRSLPGHLFEHRTSGEAFLLPAQMIPLSSVEELERQVQDLLRPPQTP